MTNEVDSDAVQAIGPFLEPGEKVLWSARPDIDSMMRHRVKSGRRTRFLVMPIFLIVAYAVLQSKVVNIPGIAALGEVVPPAVLWAMLIAVLVVAVDHFHKIHTQ